MTPAERAQELFDQMHHFQPGTTLLKEGSRQRAKQSAIIAAQLVCDKLEDHGVISIHWREVLNHLKQM